MNRCAASIPPTSPSVIWQTCALRPGHDGEHRPGDCAACNGYGFTLHFYERPGSPMGNHKVPCEACNETGFAAGKLP